MSDTQTDVSQTSVERSRMIPDGPSIAVSGDAVKSTLMQVTPNPVGERHLAFADFEEAYISKYIELADAKAGATFAVAAGVLAYLLSNHALLAILKKPAASFAFGLLALTVAVLVTSAGLAFRVVAPRRASSRGDGFVFWGTVAKFASSGEFISKVATASETAVILARLSHCYDLALICAKKYNLLLWSMRIGVFGMALAFATILTS